MSMTAIHRMNGRHKKGHIRKCDPDCLTQRVSQSIFKVRNKKMYGLFSKSIHKSNTIHPMNRRSFFCGEVLRYQFNRPTQCNYSGQIRKTAKQCRLTFEVGNKQRKSDNGTGEVLTASIKCLLMNWRYWTKVIW